VRISITVKKGTNKTEASSVANLDLISFLDSDSESGFKKAKKPIKERENILCFKS
jgi:hypothetical protein